MGGFWSVRHCAGNGRIGEPQSACRMCIFQGVEEGKTSSGDDFPAEVILIWVLRDDYIGVKGEERRAFHAKGRAKKTPGMEKPGVLCNCLNSVWLESRLPESGGHRNW